jgi:transposase
MRRDAYRGAGMSYEAIGRVFGRDHAAIIHGVRRAEQMGLVGGPGGGDADSADTRRLDRLLASGRLQMPVNGGGRESVTDRERLDELLEGQEHGG